MRKRTALLDVRSRRIQRIQKVLEVLEALKNEYSGYFRLARALSASKEYEAALKELATAASLAPGTRLFQNIKFYKLNNLFHFDLTTGFL
jgi:tetratricopeptide (TPR) repeat protein